MKYLNATTAFAFHVVVTICLTLALSYAVTRFLEAYPAIDEWLGEYLGWGSVVLILAGSFAGARAISFVVTDRFVLPWLRAK